MFQNTVLSFLADQAEDLDDEIINLGDDEDDMEDEDQARQIARAIEIVEGEDQVLALLSIYNWINISLGVSIGLDVISIEISISTPKKYQSRRSRKSRRFSKVSLDLVSMSLAKALIFSRDRDFSRLIETYRDLSRFL